MTLPEHQSLLGESMLTGAWTAACSCGWRGTPKDTMREAAAESTAHLDEVASEPAFDEEPHPGNTAQGEPAIHEDPWLDDELEREERAKPGGQAMTPDQIAREIRSLVRLGIAMGKSSTTVPDALLIAAADALEARPASDEDRDA